MYILFISKRIPIVVNSILRLGFFCAPTGQEGVYFLLILLKGAAVTAEGGYRVNKSVADRRV